MSSGEDFSEVFNDAVDAAVAAHGLTIVVAAGNDNVSTSEMSPASAAGVVGGGGNRRA